MIQAGVACIDITPPTGLAMSGFAARTEGATGAHDRLSVRAVVVNDTALVVADVLGLHEDMCRRVRRRCCLPDAHVVLAALHTHGGPASMVGRAGGRTDAAFLARLERACVEAIDRAAASLCPARLLAGMGADPDVARNRRHPGGLVDRSLPVVRIETLAGQPLAIVLSYACHPVVLGADNRLWTADYPHAVRADIERQYPGAVALFLAGCPGDANTGHSAHASLTLTANPDRSFPRAGAIGQRIAEAALRAPLRLMTEDISARDAWTRLPLARRESQAPEELEENWLREQPDAQPMRKLVLAHWIAWARGPARHPLVPWRARVSVLYWGGIGILALPGEIFAETALALRQYMAAIDTAFVIGFAEGNPGYIPPRSEFASGGYEVDEAHRYYGMPASFAPGAAEELVACACTLLRR